MPPTMDTRLEGARWRAAQTGGLAAPTLTVLCAIHCAATAVIVPWVPALAALSGSSWLETPLMLLSGVGALWFLRRTRARAPVWAAVSLALGAAAWGAYAGSELLMQGGLLTTAGVQIGLVFKSRRRCTAACCDAHGFPSKNEEDGAARELLGAWDRVRESAVGVRRGG